MSPSARACTLLHVILKFALPVSAVLPRSSRQGLLPGEEALPEVGAAPAAAAPSPDPEIVSTLMGMGFTENACKRAVCRPGRVSSVPIFNLFFVQGIGGVKLWR